MPLSEPDTVPDPDSPPPTLHQPFVHDLVGVFHAPLQAWSAVDGTMTGPGAQGIYLSDTRLASTLRLEAPGADLSALPVQVDSARRIILRDVVSLPDGIVDPVVILQRTRSAGTQGLRETIRLISDDDRERTLSLRIVLSPDATGMSAIKDPRLARSSPTDRPRPEQRENAATWPVCRAGTATLRVFPGAADESTAGGELPDESRDSARSGTGSGTVRIDGDEVLVAIDLTTPPDGGCAEVTWTLDAHDPALPFTCAPEHGWSGAVSAHATPTHDTTDPLRQSARTLLARSIADLDALRLAPADAAQEQFFAAGAPWFFTLFGRDSLITASLVLPLDLDIAESTLRTLARHQAEVHDVETAAQPGKILHELRAEGMEMADSHLPPVYYGTIDATPLWIELLHDARAAGMDDAVLTELRPHLEAAARWLLEHADADGDGFLEYLDESGHGLANQGWKDSGDSIRFADGTIAEGAIALAEVQGYAYAAARHAAELLVPGGGAAGELPARLRTWADALRSRFQEAFWCEDAAGPYIALALDGEKRRVDGVASNMGHLLGTGILDADQERLVVDRLLSAEMFSGYGIRTLSTNNGAYGPLRYHAGSVWTHDTGLILRGMLRSGFIAEAQEVARALLRAADGFDWRLPELFSGQGSDEVTPPLPYPASCRPQAWAAATAVPIAEALDVL
ncbi:MAG: amylo-alpha-1,6-glucosidase [Brachybacterium sp.]|nr:amylo-alpha-1,6-glucosidase [Brachybacterium sp.]